MKYFTAIHGETHTSEISKEEAQHYLEGAYIKEAVDDIMNNDKSFRLRTPYRDIWTVTDEGLIPMAGFYGIVG